MQLALNEKLNEAYANCTGFMLLKIDLPDSYEEAIVDTQLVHQQRLTQEKIMSVSLIQAQMEVDRSVANKNITITNAEAQADSIRFQNNVTANVIQNTVNKQSLAYQQAQTDLQLNSTNSLLDFIFYLKIMGLQKHGNTQLVVDVDRPRITLTESGKGYY